MKKLNPSIRPNQKCYFRRHTYFYLTAAMILCLITANANAMQLTTLYSCDRTNTADPEGGVTIFGDTLYGTTFAGNTNLNIDGGSDGTGTIYKINTDGTGFTIVHNFSSNAAGGENTDGSLPIGGVTVVDNILYGTAAWGGIYGYGTVFKVNTDGTDFTTLYSFSGITGSTDIGNNTNPDGVNPMAALVFSSNTLYGTANYAGSGGSGTVFKINTDGTDFTVLYSFSATDGDGNNSDGAMPEAILTLSSNVLYGTTVQGGPADSGTIFKINTDGTGFTVLHSFSALDGNTDGANPHGNLILSGNVLYGTAIAGGIYGNGTLFKINTDGTGFTTLFDFNGDNGANPKGNLVLSGTNLYGATAEGGLAGGGGAIFQINTNGANFTNLYSFPYSPFAYPNGGLPSSGVVLSGQTLYGTDNTGGTNDAGTVFSLGPDRPVILNIAANTNNGVTLSCAGEAGDAYLVQTTTNLVSPIIWQNVSTNVADASGNWQFFDSFTNAGISSLWRTNLVYAYETNGTAPPGPCEDLGPVIGTNIYLSSVTLRFYRAAVIP